VDSTSADVGRFASLDLAAPNTLGNANATYAPRIAYLDKVAANGNLKLANKSGSGVWSSAVVDTAIDPTAVGTAISLALDPANGNPRIAYRRANTLTVASSTSLTGSFLFTSLGTSGVSASLALSPTGGVRASHQGTVGTPILEIWEIGP
jgi:hypothetical protein